MISQYIYSNMFITFWLIIFIFYIFLQRRFAMTNAQINCFLTLVEEGSFAKAAGALFISQPAISKSISKLEEELGFVLLERKAGSLQPTPAGNLMYHFLKNSINNYHNLLSHIQNSLSEPSGILKLGCPETWNPAMFYNKITEHFAKEFPSVNISLECSPLPSLLAKLQSGKLDIIISHEFHPPMQYGFSVRQLTETGCGILYSRNFMKEISSVADLKDVDFLHFDSDVEKKFSAAVKKVCGDYGFSPTFKNCGQFASALFNMSCGHGVMFFTDWDNAINNTSYRYLPINYRSAVNIIYPTVTSNAKTHIFAEELIKLFAEEDE